MRIGIDWISAGILVGAFVLVQLRLLPAAVRHGVLAAAFLIVALHRLRSGAAGLNAVFVGLAGILAIYYASRALSASRGEGD